MKNEQKHIKLDRPNRTEEKVLSIVNTVGTYMKYRKLNHFEQLCRIQSMQVPKDDKRQRAIHNTCQDDGDREVTTQEFATVSSKVFYFHSIRSVIITKLKTKSSQKADRCEHKIDTGSDGNLLTTRMYKDLFLHTDINDLNKSISQKFCCMPLISHAYHKWVYAG